MCEKPRDALPAEGLDPGRYESSRAAEQRSLPRYCVLYRHLVVKMYIPPPSIGTKLFLYYVVTDDPVTTCCFLTTKCFSISGAGYR